MCKFKLCDMLSKCNLLQVETATSIDIKEFNNQEYIFLGAIPIPHLSGEWKVSLELIQDQNVIGGIRVGKPTEWLTVENKEHDFAVHDEF
ncbi:hypothetical protein KIN20_025516 [Parelaphostrongylus tenuis]|uniref:Uncharacterized protein n=1 Tax=Parelaphostrongylus tenuis TaxID=148309 RepID=A0AAD5MVB8_PARTN|nr:hypothetical protein KIN20_025516 [Parelaphostrongylus tenuis]